MRIPRLGGVSERSDNASRLLTFVSQPPNDRLSGRVLWYEQTLQKRRYAKGGIEPCACKGKPSLVSHRLGAGVRTVWICCLQTLHSRIICSTSAYPLPLQQRQLLIWLGRSILGSVLTCQTAFCSHFNFSFIVIYIFSLSRALCPPKEKTKDTTKPMFFQPSVKFQQQTTSALFM